MIFIEDNCIKVGDVVLPGILKSIEITRDAAIDEVEVEGAAVRPKQAVGYEEASIRIDLIVGLTFGETAESKAEKINRLFRAKGQSIPRPMNIVCTETMLAGINQVLFQKLTFKKDNKDDLYTFSLQFCEHSIVAVKVVPATAAAASAPEAYESQLSPGFQNYLSNRGMAPRVGDKTVQSPAVDDVVPRRRH